MLYFNTNVGATLLRGKGGGWSWLSGCFGPCERAGREPFGHTSRLEPQPRGAVTRRAVAQRRSRASGLTRPLAEAIRGFDSGFGLGFVVGQAVECDHPGAITDNVRPCAPLRLIQPGLALEPGIEAGHSGVEPRDVMAFADRLRSGYRSHSGGCANRSFKRSFGCTGASSTATNASYDSSSSAMMGRSFNISIAAASLDRSTNSVRVTPRIAAARSMSARRSSFIRKFTWPILSQQQS